MYLELCKYYALLSNKCVVSLSHGQPLQQKLIDSLKLPLMT
jgi:hypothetical protein